MSLFTMVPLLLRYVNNNKKELDTTSIVRLGASLVATLTCMSDPIRTLTAARYIAAARQHVRPRSPAELARRLDPKFVITPTIRLLSDIAVRAVMQPDQRETVSTPPRTGKSEVLAVWTPVWALMTDPDMQIVIISNGDDLAKEHSRKVREIIKEHAAFLGYSIAQDKTAVGRWQVEGRKGGMLAAGISSHIVGFGSDLMVLDDVVGGATEADSVTHRRKTLAEYQGSLATRVHPGGSVIAVGTRWHEEDLIGALVKQEPDRWRVTNIPAVSEAKVPDALGRPPGVTMISALGFTPLDFQRRRRSVGERMWYAQFQGVPNTPEGSLVKTEWLDMYRLSVPPKDAVLTVVAVDPSDSGKGDSCGLVAVSLMRDQRVALIADKSAPMTSDEWGRAAVSLAIETGASQIVIEGFSARETYTRVAREAVKRATEEGRLSRGIAVSTWPRKGQPRTGDAVARSAALLQALEVGTCVLAGHFPEFENKAVLWQPGQHQPDSLAALVVGYDTCLHASGQEWDIATPLSALTGATSSSSGGVDNVVEIDDWMRQRVG